MELNGIGINNVKLMEFEYTFVELNGIGFFGIGIDFFYRIDKKELTPTLLALEKTFSCDTIVSLIN